MGLLHSIPAKVVLQKGNSLVKVSAALTQNSRPYMEDSCRIVINEDRPHFFAMFDGHGGKEASAYYSEHLHERVFALADPMSPAALRWALLQTDEALAEDLGKGVRAKIKEIAGCTCVFAVMDNKWRDGKLRVVCSNTGDSRLYHSTADGEFRMVTIDHVPEGDEALRVVRSGSFVNEAEKRVEGNLAMTRAAGDFKYKLKEHTPPHWQTVTVAPDMFEFYVQPGDYLFLASDGVFENIPDATIAAYLEQMKEGSAPNHDEDQTQSVIDLIEVTRQKSSDNISAMLIKITGGPDAGPGTEARAAAVAEGEQWTRPDAMYHPIPLGVQPVTSFLRNYKQNLIDQGEMSADEADGFVDSLPNDDDEVMPFKIGDSRWYTAQVGDIGDFDFPRYIGTPLHDAALLGSVEDVKKAMEGEGVDVNAQDNLGNTPMHYAVLRRESMIEVINALLENPETRVGITNMYGWSALDDAVARGVDSVVVALLRRTTPEDKSVLSSALQLAIKRDYLFVITSLLDSKSTDGMTPSRSTGRTLLHEVVDTPPNTLEFRNAVSLADVGTESGPSNDTSSIYGFIHSLYAKMHGPNAAAPDAPQGPSIPPPATNISFLDGTPCHFRTRYLDTNLQRLLDTVSEADAMKASADGSAGVNARDVDGRTPLMIACANLNMRIIQYLIDHEADVNAADGEGNTPLHALYTRYLAPRAVLGECVNALLAAGANVNARNKKGETVLHLAMTARLDRDTETKVNAIVQSDNWTASKTIPPCLGADVIALIDHKAEFARTVKGRTPAHYAADSMGGACTVPLLLKYYPDGLEVADDANNTILHSFAKSSNLIIPMFILSTAIGNDERVIELARRKNDAGQTVMHLLDGKNPAYGRAVSMLMTWNFDPRDADAEGRTALHTLVCTSSAGSAGRALHDAVGDDVWYELVATKDKHGKLPVDYVTEGGLWFRLLSGLYADEADSDLGHGEGMGEDEDGYSEEEEETDGDPSAPRVRTETEHGL